MPCRDYPSEADNLKIQSDRAERIHDLTDMLCAMCKEVGKMPEESQRIIFGRLTNVAGWWSEHKARDAARERSRIEEARQWEIKNNALSKLTHEEKKLLGLYERGSKPHER
jgi:hypothetical protein